MGFRITGIDIAGFRGFNQRQRLSLDATLVQLYAPNGYGKSSLCEAIEWVLYGSTQRRLRGEQDIYKREFENYYRNRHYPKEAEAYVTVTLVDGKEAVDIKRVVADEAPRTLFVDGENVTDLRVLGIPQEPRYPMVLQHAIRDFIFAKPGTRLNWVSTQLGMGPLTNFQNDLQNASKAFKSKPEDITRATSLLNRALGLCAASPAFEPVAQLLGRGPSDSTTLQLSVSHVFKAIYGRDLPGGDAGIREIESEIKKTIARAFDASKLEIAKDIDPVFNSIAQRIGSIICALEGNRVELVAARTAADILCESRAIDLARSALPLITIDSGFCPLCGQALTKHHVDSIAQRASKAVKDLDVNKFLEGLAAALKEVRSSAESLSFYRLGEDDISRLRTLLDQPDDILSQYTAASLKCQASLKAALERFAGGEQSINGAAKAIAAPSDVGPKLDDIITTLRKLLFLLDEYKTDRAALMGVYSLISERVHGKVASSSEISRLEALKICLTESPALCLACRDRKTESNLEGCVKLVQDYSRTKRNDLLETKSTDMMAWFAELHPSTDVRFKGMKSTTTMISLLGEVFGEEVNVSSVFSEAQLNCLGLSFYAITTMAKGNPFNFVIIDDPVQSMDQQHIENFKDRYLRRMLDAGKQVVLLTHMQTLSLSVDTLFRHLSPMSLEVSSYGKEGPNIIATEEALDRMLRDIHFYMVGDSERRRQAGALLRRFVERFAKDLYRKKHGTLPKKYENASWDQLKELVRDGGLELADEGRILESHRFCGNFPHDDPTKEPPSPAEIESHHDRLKRLKEKYLKS